MDGEISTSLQHTNTHNAYNRPTNLKLTVENPVHVSLPSDTLEKDALKQWISVPKGRLRTSLKMKFSTDASPLEM